VTRASLYVYYRVAPAHRDALQRAVDALFAAARTQGAHGRWMRRRDDPSTYMEVYADVDDVDALVAFLQQECERTGFARLLGDGGTRHDEIFVDTD